MKIFMLGGTGLIGGHAARAMRAAGHDVTSLARSPESAAKLESWGIEPIAGDAQDRIALAHGIEGADVVVFAPALGDAEGPIVTWMLEQMRDSGKSFIFCSGTGVLGQRTAGEWSEDSFAEDEVYTPSRPLQSRIDIEHLVMGASSMGLARGMVVRPPAIWTHEKLHTLVTSVVASVEKTGSACYIGKGLNMYSHVHAADLGEVFRHVAETGQDGAVYHAVAGEVPNRWIAETVARIFGCGTRSVTMDEAIELWGKFATLIVLGASSRSRSPRTRREFGWVPQHTDMLAAAEVLVRELAEQSGASAAA